MGVTKTAPVPYKGVIAVLLGQRLFLDEQLY